MIDCIKVWIAYLAIGLISFVGIKLQGQDGHYWTQQYGTRSMLLLTLSVKVSLSLHSRLYEPYRRSQMVVSSQKLRSYMETRELGRNGYSLLKPLRWLAV